MDLNGLAIVAEYGSHWAARMAADELERHGIRAVVPHDPHDRIYHIGPVPGLRGELDVVDVLAPEADAERARELLAAFDAVVVAPLPPGFRDEDVADWLEAQHEASERNERQWRSCVVVVLSVVTAVVLITAVTGLVLMHR